MADAPDKDSKTEEASEKKTRDAIEKGNIPFSKETAVFGSLLGILLITWLFSARASDMQFSLARFIDNPGGWSLETGGDAVNVLAGIGWDAAKLLLPAIIVLASLGLASSLAQNPPQIVFDRIQPKLSRLSISSGWTRIFGSQGRVEFLKALFKFSAISFIGFLLVGAMRNDVLNAMFMEPSELPRLIHDVAIRLVAGVVAATVVLMAVDLVWSRVFWKRELRMTRQEVKEEHKQIDGDPLVKARMRSLARDRARRRMMAAVPRATLVIANPTHYAIALRYVREEDPAPRVLAKGKDLIALKIRSIAEENNVPVIEDKLLARSMYDKVEIDRIIPPEFYKAVAQIVFYVMSRGPKGRA